MYTISGTHESAVGMYIAHSWAKNVDSPLVPPYSAIGWVKNNKLVAQAIFMDYRGSNIEIHIYGPGFFTRQGLRDAFNYVFVQLKCNRLTARLKGDDNKLLNLLPRLGFEYEGVSKQYYGDADAPIDSHNYVLFKDKAIKYLERLNG